MKHRLENFLRRVQQRARRGWFRFVPDVVIGITDLRVCLEWNGPTVRHIGWDRKAKRFYYWMQRQSDFDRIWSTQHVYYLQPGRWPALPTREAILASGDLTTKKFAEDPNARGFASSNASQS